MNKQDFLRVAREFVRQPPGIKVSDFPDSVARRRTYRRFDASKREALRQLRRIERRTWDEQALMAAFERIQPHFMLINEQFVFDGPTEKRFQHLVSVLRSYNESVASQGWLGHAAHLPHLDVLASMHDESISYGDTAKAPLYVIGLRDDQYHVIVPCGTTAEAERISEYMGNRDIKRIRASRHLPKSKHRKHVNFYEWRNHALGLPMLPEMYKSMTDDRYFVTGNLNRWRVIRPYGNSSQTVIYDCESMREAIVRGYYMQKHGIVWDTEQWNKLMLDNMPTYYYGSYRYDLPNLNGIG